MTKKSLSVCMFVFALLLAALPLAAQYVVQPGDTLWWLEGFNSGDPTQWRRLVKLNPLLQEKGRIFEDQQGRTIALIRPGQELVGLEKLGIIPTLVPLDQLKSSPVPTPAPVVVRETPSWAFWLLGLLGLLVLLAIAYYLFRRFVLDADPVTSRAAVVPGGVTEQTAPNYFQEQAARMYQARTGQARPVQDFVVLEQTAGRAWGIVNVRYAGGREVPRRLNGETAFRARVRFPNGSEETLYMLMACGNDLRMGGISRYLPGPDFRFEADQPAQTVSTPQVTERPAPAPTPEPETTPVVAEEDGTISFEFRRASDDQPSMVRLKGIEVEEFTFTIRGRETVLRFKEVKVA